MSLPIRDFNRQANAPESVGEKIAAAAVAASKRVQAAQGIQQDPLSIPAETYILDALLQHAQAVVNQLAFRGRQQAAAQLYMLAGMHQDGTTSTLQALRNMLDSELGRLIVVPR